MNASNTSAHLLFLAGLGGFVRLLLARLVSPMLDHCQAWAASSKQL